MKKEVLTKSPTTEKRVSQFELVSHLLNAGYTPIFSQELSQGWVAYVSERSKKVHGAEIMRCYVVDEDGMVGWSHIPRSNHHQSDPLKSAIVNLRGRQMRLIMLIDVDDKARYRRKKQNKCIQSLHRQTSTAVELN